METPIPRSFKKLWDTWNLRAFILLSLSLQTFLILFAPLRKRTANNWTIMFIWSGYLLADWAANFAVGLIASSEDDTSSSGDNRDLVAFWAPFLLLHLGGPDTITAFALEDNELWLRHLLGLIFQVLAAAYVFFQTLPKNRLWVPTIFMFLAGIVKYAERTRALYLASLDSFRESMLKEPDPGPNYAKLMDEYNSKKEARLPTRIEMIPEPDRESKAASFEVKEGGLDDLEVVQYAFRFFETFKGLIVDLIFSFRERNESREFFRRRTPEDAFRVIEAELNFIYEALYTKVPVVHCKFGYFFRFVSFSSVMISLAYFHLKGNRGFRRFDAGITYTLLLGAIVLDTISLLMLIFSDRTVASLKKSKEESGLATILNNFLATVLNNFLIFKRSRLSTRSTINEVLRIFIRRWSESVSSYNLIDYCLKERPERLDKVTTCLGLKLILYKIKKAFGIVADYIGIKDFLDEINYVSRKPFSESLRNFIFNELLRKSELADDSESVKEICAARGDWALRENAHSNLLHWIDGVDYDESLLLWHIATELCFNTDDQGLDDGRDFSKLMSDYMLYLLVMQPTLMSAVAGIGQIRFRDTCAEAKKFFSRGELEAGRESIQACERILGVNTDVKPVNVKGDRSKSVLFDACILAKELKLLKDKWEIMSKVWVELLSYAASHCRASTHAQQVSKGGELISFVWLLMAHFGLGEQFQINEGHARAKLIVGK